MNILIVLRGSLSLLFKILGTSSSIIARAWDNLSHILSKSIILFTSALAYSQLQSSLTSILTSFSKKSFLPSTQINPLFNSSLFVSNSKSIKFSYVIFASHTSGYMKSTLYSFFPNFSSIVALENFNILFQNICFSTIFPSKGDNP